MLLVAVTFSRFPHAVGWQLRLIANLHYGLMVGECLRIGVDEWDWRSLNTMFGAVTIDEYVVYADRVGFGWVGTCDGGEPRPVLFETLDDGAIWRVVEVTA